jgi:hypothetical protein
MLPQKKSCAKKARRSGAERITYSGGWRYGAEPFGGWEFAA